MGIAEHFMSIASVFPNILAKIYTQIYIAAANERIFRRNDALEAIKYALDMAMPDRVYMPFVENCDYVKPLLEELYVKGVYSENIAEILELYKPYQEAMDKIRLENFSENKPSLTEREMEVAQLASEGFSNELIAERLFISQNTVKTQLKNVFKKLGINSRSLLKNYFDNNKFNA